MRKKMVNATFFSRYLPFSSFLAFCLLIDFFVSFGKEKKIRWEKREKNEEDEGEKNCVECVLTQCWPIFYFSLLTFLHRLLPSPFFHRRLVFKETYGISKNNRHPSPYSTKGLEPRESFLWDFDVNSDDCLSSQSQVESFFFPVCPCL